VALICLTLVEFSAYRRLVVVLIACAALPVLFARTRHQLWVSRLCWGVAVMMTTSSLIFAPGRESRPSFWVTLALAAVVVAAVARFFPDDRRSTE